NSSPAAFLCDISNRTVSTTSCASPSAPPRKTTCSSTPLISFDSPMIGRSPPAPLPFRGGRSGRGVKRRITRCNRKSTKAHDRNVYPTFTVHLTLTPHPASPQGERSPRGLQPYTQDPPCPASPKSNATPTRRRSASN